MDQLVYIIIGLDLNILYLIVNAFKIKLFESKKLKKIKAFFQSIKVDGNFW
jgi:hypothetical protein